MLLETMTADEAIRHGVTVKDYRTDEEKAQPLSCAKCQREITDPEDDDYHMWRGGVCYCAACCPGCGECKRELESLLPRIEKLIDKDPDVGTPDAMILASLVERAQGIERRLYPHVVEPAQPWCAQCNLPEDICRGHDDPVTVVGKDHPSTDAQRWHRCNFKQRDTGIVFCDGDHERSEPCMWQPLTVQHVEAMAQRLDAQEAPAAQIAIGADAIPADVAEALFAKHGTAWCSRLVADVVAQPEPRLTMTVVAGVDDDEHMAQLRVAQ